MSDASAAKALPSSCWAGEPTTAPVSTQSINEMVGGGVEG